MKLISLLWLKLLFATSLLFFGCSHSEKLTSNSNKTDDGHFQNPSTFAPHKSFFRFLWMRLQTDWVDVSKAHLVPRSKVDLEKLYQPEQQQVIWLGHSSFLLQIDGVNILTDPVFSERASPISFMGPKRYTKPSILMKDLPVIHAVVISHNHYDHLDQDSIQEIEKRFDPLWFVPLKNGPLLQAVSVPTERIVELDWWESSIVRLGSLEAKAVFTATPAQHWSARGLFDRNEMLWSSWSIQINKSKIFFGGDTGYNQSYFTSIGEKLGPFDLGLIPIGAYAPRDFMKYAHVSPSESVKIHNDIKCKRSLGAHWGTFPLTAEPVMDPVNELKKAVKVKQLASNEFIAPKLGHIYLIKIEKY